jgi:hypothetical protein
MRTADRNLQGIVADMQHHHTITGTSPISVIHDYMNKIQTSIEASKESYSHAIEIFMRTYGIVPIDDQ